MKTQKYLIIATLGLVVLISGCYTQLETIKNEKKYVDEYYDNNRIENYSQEEQSDTFYYDRDGRTIINNYYFDGGAWYPRYRWMFSYYPSYYWPSYAFSMVYYDPWFYDRYWYYDPWICGTPYVYYPHYYYPYYYGSYYPYYWGSHYYISTTGTVERTKRDFGNQRDKGGRGAPTYDDRQDRISGRGGLDLPTGVGVTGGGGRSQTGSTPEVRKPSRGDGTSGKVTPRSTDRSGSSRGEGSQSRSGSRRDRYENSDRGQSVPPATRESGRRNEGSGRRDEGSTRSGETRTYTPPPPPTPQPAPSSPPPSSPPPQRGNSRGGSDSGDSGSRGGNTRGGR
ncbi:MAG: hypothetical protein QME25_04805 [Bacteroidota bacterium]|nr:hypothetical protein [Bacteroidota bacterium]